MPSGRVLFSRLQRIRSENLAARVTEGLGARNVPYARAYGGLPLAADVSGYAGDMPAIEQAEAALRRLEREVIQLTAQTDKAERRVRSLRESVRTSEALNGGTTRKAGKFFEFKRGKIQAGALELGRGGFGLDGGWLRAAGGRFFSVALVGQAVAGAARSVLDVRDSYRSAERAGATGGEMARAAGLAVAGGTREALAGMLGVDSLTESGFRAMGLSAEDAQRARERFYDRLFTTREELERRASLRQAAIAEANRGINAAVGDAWRKLDTQLPHTFKLSGRSDLRQYRAELRDQNRQLLSVREEALKDEARRAIDARDAGGS